MPFDLVVNQSIQLATVTMWGPVDGPEVAAALNAIYESPSWAAGNTIYWDVAEITECLFEQEDYFELVAIHQANERLAPRAEVILVKRIMEKTTSKVYSMFMLKAKHKVYVCDSLSEATALLQGSLQARSAPR